jgi:H+/Cl- antiporter ClcA
MLASMDSTSEDVPPRRRRDKIAIYGASLLTGIAAGAIAVAYRVSLSWVEGVRHEALMGEGSWPRAAAFVALATLAGIGIAFMLKRSPLISGSGIPQVKAAIAKSVRFDWIRELPFKFAGGVAALGGGLSLGREGPSIHLGALSGEAIARVAGKPELSRYLLTAGAAAGISAAFNAPLAAVLFCVEELHRGFSPTMLECSMTAAFSAYAVSWIALGNAPVFEFHLEAQLPLEHYPWILAVGIACALAGRLFNAGLLGAQGLAKRLMPSPIARAALMFPVAAGIVVAFPAIAGGGHALVEQSAAGSAGLAALALLFAGKFAFTAYSYATGAPGGIFLPMLVIGALLGSISADIGTAIGIPAAEHGNFVMLGMVGFFTAVVRAPITSAILISEMSGSFTHFPALILVSVVATIGAAALGARPIYDELIERMGIKPPKETKPRAAGEVE